jgi:hypothetical protein
VNSLRRTAPSTRRHGIRTLGLRSLCDARTHGPGDHRVPFPPA